MINSISAQMLTRYLDVAALRQKVLTANIANVDTPGYKQTRTTFRDMFYQNVGSNGSGNPIQIGAGAAVGSVSTIFSGSNIETSGVPTDVAISGEGFFVVERDGVTRYTRAGNFTTSPDGTLSTENGEYVMGYPAPNGIIDPSQGLIPLQMGKGQISPPNATAMVEMRTNLDATADVGYSFNSPMTVYDSLGSAHVVSFRFTKTAANTWNYDITLPAGDSGAAADTSLASGVLRFDGAGTLTSPAANVSGITTPALANGADAITFDWNLYDNGTGMMTQLAAASATASKHQDGFGSGTLEDFTIGSDGIVQGSFNNGKTMAIGQLALANFPNTQGLQRAGNNNFEATLASGLPAIGAPGTGGRGSVAGGALELSNVDIASEFAKMIVAQRGFQANARAVTTFDEITQETINLKR